MLLRGRDSLVLGPLSAWESHPGRRPPLRGRWWEPSVGSEGPRACPAPAGETSGKSLLPGFLLCTQTYDPVLRRQLCVTATKLHELRVSAPPSSLEDQSTPQDRVSRGGTGRTRSREGRGRGIASWRTAHASGGPLIQKRRPCSSRADSPPRAWVLLAAQPSLGPQPSAHLLQEAPALPRPSSHGFPVLTGSLSA